MGEEFNFTNDDIRTEQERVQDDIQDINNEYYDVNYQIIYAQIVNNALTQNSLRCKSSGEVAKWISDNLNSTIVKLSIETYLEKVNDEDL